MADLDDEHDADLAHVDRRLANWGFERRQQRRQERAFIEQIVRIRATSNSDPVAAAVFHGERHVSRQQRILDEHNERQRAKARAKARARESSKRRRQGLPRICPACTERFYDPNADTCGCHPCVHCGSRFRGEGRKCPSCKADPELITARGSETRSFVPRKLPQPSITPLSMDAKRIEAAIEQLPNWLADPIERHYLERESEHNSAEALRISPAAFTGRLTRALKRVALMLASPRWPPV